MRWHLAAPDWASLDTIWRSPQPFVLWPVCDKPLLSYWLDEAVRAGVESVSIEAVDRPHLIRQWLDQRDLWSRSIEIHSKSGVNAEWTRVVMQGLPGADDPPPIVSAKDLMNHWYHLQVEALRRRASGMVHLDHEYRPGVWFGPGAGASADAIFTPPCWVGSRARIGPGCRIGPHAFIGAGVILDSDVEVAEAIVLTDTYVGSHTTLKRGAVQGGLLMDFERGVGVEVVDEFVLARLGGPASSPPWFERLLAAVAMFPLEGIARLFNLGVHPSETTVQVGRSRRINLRSYPEGPLVLRRSGWLGQVAAGHLRLVGVLPRTGDDWENLPSETRSALEQAPVGVFALSDLYHCHSPGQPDEWMHAVFQAGSADGIGQRMAWKSLPHIALTTPAES